MAKQQTTRMTPMEAAVYLHSDVTYIYRLLRNGKLAAEREDGRWYISTEALKEYRAEHPGIGHHRVVAAVEE